MSSTKTSSETLSRFLGPSVIANHESLHRQFRSAEPFRHLMVNDFLSEPVYRGLIEEFPPFSERNAINEHGHIGRKSVRERVRSLGPSFRAFDDFLRGPEFLGFISDVTGIDDLLYDPLYIGGGTHENRNGKALSPHIDFNYHPKYGWHRRLNLILFLNERWEEGWGGNLQLHSDPWDPTEDRVATVVPTRNRVVLFETTEWSWHGFPHIRLPEDNDVGSRRSFALYLYSRERPPDEANPLHSTVYVPLALPEGIRPGATLSQTDYGQLKGLLDSRTHLLRWLYEREKLLAHTIDSLQQRHPVRRIAAKMIDAVRPVVYRLRRRATRD